MGTFRTSTCPPHLRQRSCRREFSSCDVNVLFGLHVFRTPIYFSSRDVNAALCICRHRRQSLLQLPWWCSPKIQALVPHNDRMFSRPSSFDETVDLSLAINEWVLCIPSLQWHFRYNSLRQPQNVCVNFFRFLCANNYYKKLSYRRGTALCVVSIEILPIATQQCRNYL